jgi:hypothetical protein
MKWLIIFFMATSTLAFQKAEAQTGGVFGKNFLTGVDSEEIRKHPPTAPVFYKDVKSETSSDSSKLYMRKYLQAPGAAPHDAEALTAPKLFDTLTDFPQPARISRSNEKIPKENIPPSAPLFKPRE